MDNNGTPIGSAERNYTVNTPYPGWSAQNPSNWIDALNAAFVELKDTHVAFSNLLGIGVAGHMHGDILLNKMLMYCVYTYYSMIQDQRRKPRRLKVNFKAYLFARRLQRKKSCSLIKLAQYRKFNLFRLMLILRLEYTKRPVKVV